MQPKNETPRTSEFNGLNNMVDPVALDLSWATVADNVDITNKQKLVRTKGHTRVTSSTAISGAYATKDFSRAYVIDNGLLIQLNKDMSAMRTLRTGLSLAPYAFDEVNGVVYFTNGIDFGMIDGDGAKPWGISDPDAPQVLIENGGSLQAGVYQIVCTFVDKRGLESSNSDVVVAQTTGNKSRLFITGIPQATGYTTNVYATNKDGNVLMLLRENCGPDTTYDASDKLYRELPFWNTNTPRGSLVAYFGGRMYTAEHFPSSDMSAIWSSLPLHFHHFDPGSEGTMVPGKALVIRGSRETHFTGNERLTQRGVADALIIGTDREIYTWDGDQLVLLASYGVIPGQHAVEFKGKLYFWTQRGLCRALPFENLHESTVSVPPGLSAAGAVIEKDGTRRYVVALVKGGDAFNPKQ